MKNLLTLFSSFLAVISSAQIHTVVCGKITNPKGSIVKLSCWDGEMRVQTTSLNKNGYFKIVTRLTKPIAHDIEHGEEVTHVFLSPGDSIYLTLDTKKFDETVTYSGKGADVNNYLAKQYLTFEDNLESETFQRGFFTKIATLKPNAFSAFVDSIEAIRLSYLNARKKELPETFYNYQFAEIVFKSAKDKADYPMLHYYVRGIKDSVVKVDEAYNVFYDNNSLTNEDYLVSNYFVIFLESYVRYYARKEYQRDSLSVIDQVNIARKRLVGRVREKAIEQLVLRSFQYNTTNEVREMYAIALADIKDSASLALIESKYNQVTALFPGNPAPAISLKTREDKKVSLSDFKGKVVYLDFWASWCGPCMIEMPYAKKLQDTFANQDVVFLYVSVDESKQAWIQAMDSKKMRGVHVWAKGFEHAVPKSYAVEGIPSYFLIDRQGKIISNNPSRPSGKNVVAEIQEALRK
jgi:thiol-disulfide isomerase/thioredoxin